MPLIPVSKWLTMHLAGKHIPSEMLLLKNQKKKKEFTSSFGFSYTVYKFNKLLCKMLMLRVFDHHVSDTVL